MELEKIERFVPQKNLIKSQVNYFQEEYKNAMDYDEKALPFNDQWYAGNIISEHFFAYSNSAMLSNQIGRTATFYKEYLANKRSQNLPEHKINFYKHQISQHLQKIKGEKDLIINTYKPYEIKKKGVPIEKFYDQYKRIRKKSDFKSKDAIGYIFDFLLEYGNTEECLNYYEKKWESILTEDSHLKVAQIYRAKNETGKSQDVVYRFAAKFWYPIEYLQIVPVKLWSYEDLIPILDKELKREILKVNRNEVLHTIYLEF